MPLTNVSLVAQVSWALSRTNPPFGNSTEGPDTEFFSLNGISTTTFNQLAANQYTITSSSTTNIDLTSLTNLLYESFSFGHVLSIMVLPTGDQVTLAPGASNGLVWFFGSSSQSITIPAGGCFVFSLPPSASGQVVNSTHKILSLTASGAGSSTVTVVILGSTT